MDVFEKVTELIDEHNEKFLNGDSTFSVDVNEHSALVTLETICVKKNKKTILVLKNLICT